MKRNNRNSSPASVALIRCAISPRKSTEEGRVQEFDSLDAQREAVNTKISCLGSMNKSQIRRGRFRQTMRTP